VALSTVLGGLLATGYLFLTPPEATATSVVSVAPIISDPYSANRSSASLVDIQTEAQAASSMSVATLAATTLGPDVQPAELRSRLTTTPISSTTVMRVAITAPTAAQARAEADAVANAFLDYRSQQATVRIQAVLDKNSTRLDTLRQQLNTVNKTIASTTAGSAEHTQAQTDKDLLQQQISTLADQSSTFEDVDTSGGQVLTYAQVNAVTWSPSTPPVLAGGLLVGAVLGLVGAFVRQARDRQVRLSADIVDAGVGPVLARLASPESGRDRGDHGALAVARERLLAHPTLCTGRGVLAYVEDPACPSAPDVAADLARTFADGGIQVHVICVPTEDGYSGAMSRLLDLQPHVGAGAGALESSIDDHVTAWWPQKRRGWMQATRHQLEAVSGDHLVIVVCPAGADDADRMAVCRIADAVVVFAVERVSQRASLHALRASAQAVDAPVLGAVVAAFAKGVPADHTHADVEVPRHALDPHQEHGPAEPVDDSPASSAPEELRAILSASTPAAEPEGDVEPEVAADDDEQLGRHLT
jgi:capsular polysaccharide biosynthesis protein